MGFHPRGISLYPPLPGPQIGNLGELAYNRIGSAAAHAAPQSANHFRPVITQISPHPRPGGASPSPPLQREGRGKSHRRRLGGGVRSPFFRVLGNHQTFADSAENHPQIRRLTDKALPRGQSLLSPDEPRLAFGFAQARRSAHLPPSLNPSPCSPPRVLQGRTPAFENAIFWSAVPRHRFGKRRLVAALQRKIAARGVLPPRR